jgi:hypothetical protein
MWWESRWSYDIPYNGISPVVYFDNFVVHAVTFLILEI